MDDNVRNNPKGNRGPEPIPADIQICQEMHEARQIANTASETSQEIATHTLDDPAQTPLSPEGSRSITITGPPVQNEEITPVSSAAFPVPFLLISAPSSLVLPATHTTRTRSCNFNIQSPITSQPLMSPHSLRKPCSTETRPPSLFLQALRTLTTNSSMNVTVLNNLIAKSQYLSLQNDKGRSRFGDLSPPDSLNSAPPSYSYVLRQMAVRRRPRLMGTFIPSPSFIPHVPPPNYNAAFDIYVDNTLPTPPTRVRRFGFASVPTVCPECGYTGMTVVTSKITMCTHLCAIVLCLLCCWVCVPLPYVLRSCKDVYHHCRNCRNFLGMYCPTNAETSLPWTKLLNYVYRYTA